ncbi:hypothetical protein ACW9IB_01230 [Pseudomonas sp. SDO524_S393]
MPDVKEIVAVLAAQFIHDPGFQIRVNGTPLTLAKLEQHARTHTLNLSEGRLTKVIVINSTQQNHSSI